MNSTQIIILAIGGVALLAIWAISLQGSGKNTEVLPVMWPPDQFYFHKNWLQSTPADTDEDTSKFKRAAENAEPEGTQMMPSNPPPEAPPTNKLPAAQQTNKLPALPPKNNVSSGIPADKSIRSGQQIPKPRMDEDDNDKTSRVRKE
jgi:hypothetical protein